MAIIKDIIFWWLVLDGLLLVISKHWRKERISYLNRLDKKS